MSELEQLREDVKALTRELRRFRHGELVTRLSQAERQQIAQLVVDRLDERQHAQQRKELPR